MEGYMKVDFWDIGQVEDKELKFGVTGASFENKWIFVRHKQRSTWEMPGGHREQVEDINETAKRELYEETGAKVFEMHPICDYSVTNDETTTYGRLCYAKVSEMGILPDLEIGEIKLFENLPLELTYPEILPILFEKIHKEVKRQNTLSIKNKP
jgi:8-oxo-dGTP diphosphatase